MPDSPLPLTADERAELARLAEDLDTLAAIDLEGGNLTPEDVAAIFAHPDVTGDEDTGAVWGCVMLTYGQVAALIRIERTGGDALLASLARVEGERDEARARARAEDDAALRQIHDLAEDNDRLVRERDTARAETARLEAELAEVRAALENERGEGAGPTQGWVFDFVWRDGDPVDHGWHKGGAYVESSARYDEGGWRANLDGREVGRYPTARAGMAALDLALAGGVS